MHYYLHIFRVTERGQASFCASNVDKCYLKDSWYNLGCIGYYRIGRRTAR